MAYSSQAAYPVAVKVQQEALTIFRAALGDEHVDVARCHGSIGQVQLAMGENAKALQSFEAALPIFRKASGERDPDVAKCYNSIAIVQYHQGRYPQAIEGFRKALGITRAIFGPRHPEVGNCLNNLANVLSIQGEYAEAIERLEEALRIFRAAYGGDRNYQVAACYHNIAEVHRLRGDDEAALEGFQKALDLRRRVLGERHPDVALTLNNMGIVYRNREEYSRALDSYARALAIRRTVFGERHPAVADTYNNIAEVRMRQGDDDRAMEGVRKALNIRRERLGDHHPDVALCYNNIDCIYFSKHDYDKALDSFQRALRIRRMAFGERHPEVGRTYMNVGAAFVWSGRLGPAADAYQAALDILRATQGERSIEVAMIHYGLAIPSLAMGRADRAIEALDQAVAALATTADVVKGARDEAPSGRLVPQPITLTVLLLRGAVKERGPGRGTVEDLRSCLDDYLVAADLVERIRLGIGRGDLDPVQRVLLAQPDKLHLGEDQSSLFPSLIGVIARLAEVEHTPGRLAGAFTAAERGSARVFLEDLARSRATVIGRVDRTLLAEESRRLAEVRQADARIATEQARPLEGRDCAAVERLFAERVTAEGRLHEVLGRMERDYPQYAAFKYPKACTLQEARACLAEDEVALLYVPGSRASYLVVVARDDDPKTAGIAVHRLPPAAEIGELVTALTRPEVLQDTDSTRELGARAYRMLLAPAAGAIRGKSLVIVPGGVLGLLPFQLLVEPTEGTRDDAREGRFLVERHRIRYAPSLTTLHVTRRWNQERKKPDRWLWAVGDPVYLVSDARRAAPAAPDEKTRRALTTYGRDDGGSFPRLVYSAEEMERLRRLWGALPGEMLVGTAATEAAVKAASDAGTLARYHYVHFATHGLLHMGGSIQPALVLSLIGDHGGEDGFLRLDEVTSLKLNADLVVLSACRTDQGRLYEAEGVSGLARAFLYAGSRGVLCSLWRVPDQATSELMTDIYAGLKEKRSTADALRDAQRKMIADDRPPLDWAPFVLIGE